MKKQLLTFTGILSLFTAQAQLPSVSSGTLRLWLRADAGVITNANRQVSQWQDQSTSTNNASQSNTNAQPILVANVLNSHPVIRFDGIQNSTTGDYLQGIGSVGLTNTYTAFLVYKALLQNVSEQVPALIGVPGSSTATRGYYDV